MRAHTPKSKVKSTDSTKVDDAVDKGKMLADASEVLANTTFIEANRGELIVFGSKNSTGLTGKEIEKGYYLLGGSQRSQTKSSAETLTEQLTERRKEVAELERKLEEAIKAEKDKRLHIFSSRKLIDHVAT